MRQVKDQGVPVYHLPSTVYWLWQIQKDDIPMHGKIEDAPMIFWSHGNSWSAPIVTKPGCLTMPARIAATIAGGKW